MLTDKQNALMKMLVDTYKQTLTSLSKKNFGRAGLSEKQIGDMITAYSQGVVDTFCAINEGKA